MTYQINDKNIYESNLPDDLKKMVSTINKFIVAYLIENFKDKENINHYISKVIENMNELKYGVVDNINAVAAFVHSEDINSEKALVFTKDSLNLYDVNNKLISIYFHEFSHFLSYIVNGENISKELEEGFADLFSDELVDFFNLLNQENKIAYKDSTYDYQGAIVRNASILNGSSSDLLWEYYNGKNNTLKKVYDDEILNKIYELNSFSDIDNSIYRQIEAGIKQKLKIKEVLNLNSRYIMRNPIVCDLIIDEVQNKKYDEKYLKENYKNIPNYFYKNYSSKLSKSHNMILDLMTKEYIDDNEVDAIAEEVLSFFRINNYKDATHKYGIYDNYPIDFMLDITSIGSICFKTVYAYMLSYELKYKIQKYDEEKINSDLYKIGMHEIINKDYIKSVKEAAKSIYNKTLNINSDEHFSLLKNVIKQEVKNDIYIKFYTKKLDSKQISISDYCNALLLQTKRSNQVNNLFSSPLYSCIIDEFVSENTRQLELNENNYNLIKNDLIKLLGNKDKEFLQLLNGKILAAWDKNNISYYNFVDLVGKYPIGTGIDSNTFDDINVLGLSEVKNSHNVENIIKYLKACDTKNYKETKSVNIVARPNGMMDINNNVQQINEIIRNTIIEEEKNENKEIYKLIETNDDAFINFFECLDFIDLSQDDIKYLANVKKEFDNDYNQIDIKNMSDFARLNYNEEIYNKLKAKPHLAAMYINHFLDNYKYFGDFSRSLKVINENSNNTLGEKTLKKYMDLCKNFDVSSLSPKLVAYETFDKEISFYQELIKYGNKNKEINPIIGSITNNIMEKIELFNSTPEDDLISNIAIWGVVDYDKNEALNLFYDHIKELSKIDNIDRTIADSLNAIKEKTKQYLAQDNKII